MVKQNPNGKGWLADFRPEGRSGPRVRRVFIRKRDAEEFEIAEKAKAQNGNYLAPKKDNRRLSDLVTLWFDLHGHTLKDGAPRKRILLNTCQRLGNPLGRAFTAEQWLQYRKNRVGSKNQKGLPMTPNGVNHEQAYLSAVFGTLIKLKKWQLDNPLRGVPKLKIDEPELIFLDKKQIERLLDELKKSRNKNAYVIARICLATGARWGEAEKLLAKHVNNCRVQFVGTKNSKARLVPIAPALEEEIKTGRPSVGRLFEGSAFAAFEFAVERAGIDLPAGQMTHVLRHTFASWYMINDGNILKLKETLGHKTLAMTMRYAKLAPGHLIDALDKNPLATIESVHKVSTQTCENGPKRAQNAP